MSEHKATLSWTRGEGGFGIKEFTRSHQWGFPRSEQELRASSGAEYMGTDYGVDPEEGFTAALSSCHMLTFLAVASLAGYVVDSYEDTPIGYLEKGDNGRPWLARIVMHPHTKFSGEKQPSSEELFALHSKSHRACFLANSVKTEITWEPSL